MTPTRTWTDTRYSSPQGSIRRHDTDSRPRMRLLWWVQRYGLTRDEWRAARACAEQMREYRTWLIASIDDRSPGQRDTWERPSADEILTRESGHPRGSLRSSQLAQVAMEVCHHMGVRLSDYKWKANKERRRRERREKERSAA